MKQDTARTVSQWWESIKPKLPRKNGTPFPQFEYFQVDQFKKDMQMPEDCNLIAYVETGESHIVCLAIAVPNDGRLIVETIASGKYFGPRSYAFKAAEFLDAIANERSSQERVEELREELEQA